VRTQNALEFRIRHRPRGCDPPKVHRRVLPRATAARTGKGGRKTEGRPIHGGDSDVESLFDASKEFQGKNTVFKFAYNSATGKRAFVVQRRGSEQHLASGLKARWTSGCVVCGVCAPWCCHTSCSCVTATTPTHQVLVDYPSWAS